MSNETIKVYFEPLGTKDGLNYYHQTLVYTNSQGYDFVASAGSTSNPPAGTSELAELS